MRTIACERWPVTSSQSRLVARPHIRHHDRRRRRRSCGENSRNPASLPRFSRFRRTAAGAIASSDTFPPFRTGPTNGPGSSPRHRSHARTASKMPPLIGTSRTLRPLPTTRITSPTRSTSAGDGTAISARRSRARITASRGHPQSHHAYLHRTVARLRATQGPCPEAV